MFSLLILVSLLLFMLLLLIMMVMVGFQDVAYSFLSFVHILDLAFPKSVVVMSQGPVALVSPYIMQQPAMSTHLSYAKCMCMCIAKIPLFYPFLSSRMHTRKRKAKGRKKNGPRKNKENDNKNLRQSPSLPRRRHGCCH